MPSATTKTSPTPIETAGRVLGDVIEIGPDIVQAGREVADLGQAIKFATSSESEGGKKITKAEARRILKEAGQAAQAALRLVGQLLPLVV